MCLVMLAALLGACADEAQREDVVGALPSPQTRRHTTATAREQPDALPEPREITFRGASLATWRKRLYSGDEQTAAQAVKELEALPLDDLRATLSLGLPYLLDEEHGYDVDSDAYAVLNALAHRIVPELRELLRDPDPELRKFALRVLGCAQDVDAVQDVVRAAILAGLEDPDEGVIAAASTILDSPYLDAEPTRRWAVVRLTQLLGSSRSETRRASARLLADAADLDSDQIAALIAMLGDPDDGVRSQASEIAVDLGYRSVPTLTAHLRAKSASLRALATEAIGNLDLAPPARWALLAPLLDDADRRGS